MVVRDLSPDGLRSLIMDVDMACRLSPAESDLISYDNFLGWTYFASFPSFYSYIYSNYYIYESMSSELI